MSRPVSEPLPTIPTLASKYRTAVSALASVLFLLFATPSPASLKWGALVICLGEALRVWSSGHIVKNDRISREGPYSLSRNPLYVGNFVIGWGFVAAAGNFWIVPFFLGFFSLLYYYTIKYEEKFLEMKFPEEWSDYHAAVPRFFSLSALADYMPGYFSWGLVVKHREIRNLPALLAAFVILWVKYAIWG